MIEIKTLTELDFDRFHQIGSGYISHEKYMVTKSEQDDQTMIALTLHPLKQPYVKVWEHDEWTDTHYQEILKEGLSLGLYEDGEMIGVALAEKREWNRTLWIWEFHIAPEQRGKGHGRRLMDALAEAGRGAGCRIMVAEAQNTNVPAIRFYRKVGFEVGGIDLSYYTNQDVEAFEVAVFMKRKIEP